MKFKNEILSKVEKAGLWINPEKCHILKKEIKFLKHVINGSGIQTDPFKLEAIKSFQRPNCPKDIRRFIKNYANKSRVLEELSGRNNKKLVWTEACSLAFKEIKKA